METDAAPPSVIEETVCPCYILSIVVLKLQLHNGNILVNNMTLDIFNQAHMLVLKRLLLYTI